MLDEINGVKVKGREAISLITETWLASPYVPLDQGFSFDAYANNPIVNIMAKNLKSLDEVYQQAKTIASIERKKLWVQRTTSQGVCGEQGLKWRDASKIIYSLTRTRDCFGTDGICHLCRPFKKNSS